MNLPADLILLNATLADPGAGIVVKENIGIRRGLLLREPFSLPPGTPTLDAGSLWVCPGLTDLHTHLREPGHEEAETLMSGSLAAAHGGFTRLLAMPNTLPPLDRPERLRPLQERARNACADILFSACLSLDRAGREPADYEALRDAGAAAFTDDGSTPDNPELMLRAASAAARLNLPILDHAENAALARGGVMHDGPHARHHGLPGIPSEAETAVIERDIALAEQTGCRIHIQHLSTRRGVELVAAARDRGLPVTAEATPHHLALADRDVDPLNSNFKVNPPLRSADDRAALREALAAGIITVLATDHAPHTSAAKRLGFRNAPFGVTGLETAMALTYDLLVKTRRMDPLAWLRCWTSHPAELLRLPPPSLQNGQPANLMIFDPGYTWIVAPDDFHSRSVNSPFIGHTLTTRPLATLLRGRWTWISPDLEASFTRYA